MALSSVWSAGGRSASMRCRLLCGSSIVPPFEPDRDVRQQPASGSPSVGVRPYEFWPVPHLEPPGIGETGKRSLGLVLTVRHQGPRLTVSRYSARTVPRKFNLAPAFEHPGRYGNPRVHRETSRQNSSRSQDARASLCSTRSAQSPSSSSKPSVALPALSGADDASASMWLYRSVASWAASEKALACRTCLRCGWGVREVRVLPRGLNSLHPSPMPTRRARRVPGGSTRCVPGETRLLIGHL